MNKQIKKPKKSQKHSARKHSARKHKPAKSPRNKPRKSPRNKPRKSPRNKPRKSRRNKPRKSPRNKPRKSRRIYQFNTQPSLQSIIRDVVPYLNHHLETCLYYNQETDQWFDGTYQGATNFMCQHNQGYREIMGHTHPLRQGAHQQEVNYYPSCPDFLLPVLQPVVQFNYIITPIGIYVASYSNGGDYNQQQIQEVRNLMHNCREIDEHMWPLHTLTMNMINNSSLQEVMSLVTEPMVQQINSLCAGIEMAVNNIITNYGLPPVYSVLFRRY